jgi:arylsulfatase A-like enzyme
MSRLARLILFALVAAGQGGTPARAETRRPNILVVLFDDVGFTDFGAFGSVTRTPHIDALSRNGRIFTRYYTSPFCGPSRAMLMTGLDNHQVGMGTLVEALTPDMRGEPSYSMVWNAGQPTIASRLKGVGYQTYVTGKWGIGASGNNLPNRFGFDRSYVMDATGGSNYDMRPYLPGYDRVPWYEDGVAISLPTDFYSSRSLVDRMIAYIDAGDSGTPFFAFLSLQAVHIPVQAPLSFIDGYNGAFDAGWDVMRADRHRRAIELGLVPPTTRLAPVPQGHRPWAALSAAERAVEARKMQVGAGMMEAADFHIGRLLKHLDATGKLDDTIVVVTSDNGPEPANFDLTGLTRLAFEGMKLMEGLDTSADNLGQPGNLMAIGPEWASVSASPFHLYKFYTSEGGLRVPLVVAGPGIAATGIHDGPIHVADLVPTLLDAAGASYRPEEFYGRSFLPVLSGAARAARTEIDSFGFEVSGNAALYRGPWKLVRLARPLGDFEWRLFDLSVDPGETTDVSAQNQRLVAEMQNEYLSYVNKVGAIQLGPEDYAQKQIFENATNKALIQFGPSLLAVLAGLGLALFAAHRLLGVFGRRSAR